MLLFNTLNRTSIAQKYATNENDYLIQLKLNRSVDWEAAMKSICNTVRFTNVF